MIRIVPGDIVEYEEPARIYHRYLVLEILKEDEQSIQCQCLVYTGSGCSIIPYTICKHDNYQRTKVIGHINILLLSEASTVKYDFQIKYELLKTYW